MLFDPEQFDPVAVELLLFMYASEVLLTNYEQSTCMAVIKGFMLHRWEIENTQLSHCAPMVDDITARLLQVVFISPDSFQRQPYHKSQCRKIVLHFLFLGGD